MGVNTTGAAPAATNLFEVLQPSTTTNTVGIYTSHTGAVAGGTGYGFQAIKSGASLNNIAAYLSATGATNNYALIIPPSGGRVGIWTTTPLDLLSLEATGGGRHVTFQTTNLNAAEDVRIGIRAEGDGSDTRRNAVIFGTTVGTGGSDSYLAFETNKYGTSRAERMRIDPIGNIGIGTTAPSTLLHLSSSTINSNGLLIESTSNSNSSIANVELRGRRGDANQSPGFIGGLYLSTLRSDQMMDADPTSATVYNNLGIIAFGANHTNGSSANILYPASISALAESDFTNSTTMPTALLFRTSSSGKAKGLVNDEIGTERMRITSTGNMGIGTTSPTQTLHVRNGNMRISQDGNNAIYQSFSYGAAVASHFIGYRTEGTEASPTYPTADQALVNFQGRNGISSVTFAGMSIYTSENQSAAAMGDHIRFYTTPNGTTSSTEKMRILNNGNVGIGTASPLKKFHVSTTGVDGIITEAAEPILVLKETDGNANENWWMNVATGNLELKTVNDALSSWSSALFTIKQDGNVGIGTTNPSAKLTVAGVANFDTERITLGAATGATNERMNITYDAGVATYRINGLSGVHVSLGSGGTNDVLFLKNNGNVGIGCTNPTANLHVTGTIRSTTVINTAALACSDERYKKNIKKIDNALINVLKMKGVNYYWKSKAYPEWDFNNRKQIGFIAQEIELIYPELVNTDEQGYKSVDYSKLTPILVEAIKDLSAISEEQQRIIDNHQHAIEGLKVENSTLLEKVNEISSLQQENQTLQIRIHAIEKYLNSEANKN